ncbi:MAG: dTDP-4-dehydrorhamnose reductase [Bacteroidales bacterium]|nr:dTDP-4-dehydrorhamnose reductase [Bacteroidales bacterium]
MKIAVLGAQGQLGRDLVPRLPGKILPLTRAELNLDQPETLAAVLADLRPDLLINTAAYNFVDKAEQEPEAAFRVNAWGVRALATACRDVGCKLVHFSTDYVFGLDAARSTPLRETDPPGPVSVYGLSKLAGEYVVQSIVADHLVIRTCGLYGVWGSGGKGGNFVETMLRVAGQGKPLRVVSDQFCTPTYTADLAALTVELIATGATGLFHVVNAGACSWYEFAAEIFRQSGLTADLSPITSAQFGAPARRPSYSVLSTDRLVEVGVSAPRLWPDALAHYLAERQQR